MSRGIFVDWITASQHHSEGGLPVVTGGCLVHYDASGLPRFERNCAASVPGSFATSVRVGCDGFRVSISGNVGRFGRADNLFNHGWAGTVERCNRILALCGLPPFSASRVLPGGQVRRGAVVSRVDVTCNFKTGSESQARSVVRWLASRSVARMKRGFAGDESVWWANTRHMLKAYLKHVEMVKHGASASDAVVQWCQSLGVLRVEIELKRRLLGELGLNDLENIDDDKLAALFESETSILRTVDRSDDVDIIDAIPQRSRAYASAWLAGQDVRPLCSRATLFRHARVLRAFGLDILEPRSVTAFPVRIRVVDLEALSAPDWYEWERIA